MYAKGKTVLPTILFATLLGAASSTQAVSPEDFTEEVDKKFVNGYDSYVNGTAKKAAAEIRKGGESIEKESRKGEKGKGEKGSGVFL